MHRFSFPVFGSGTLAHARDLKSSSFTPSAKMSWSETLPGERPASGQTCERTFRKGCWTSAKKLARVNLCTFTFEAGLRANRRPRPGPRPRPWTSKKCCRLWRRRICDEFAGSRKATSKPTGPVKKFAVVLDERICHPRYCSVSSQDQDLVLDQGHF